MSFTDPNYKQLISADELIQPLRAIKKERKRHDKQRNDGSPDPSLERGPEGPSRDFAEKLPEPSHGASFVNRFFTFILSTADPWRLSMGFAVIFLMLNAGASRGWLSIPGLPPLAIAESVTEIRVEQLDGQIESAVKDHCGAATEKAKGYYYGRIRELKTKYRRVSMEPHYEPPTCRDLGVPEIVVGHL